MLKKNFFFPLKISSMMGFSYLNSLCSHTFHYNVIVPPTQHSFSHISRNDILFCVISTTNSNIELKETDLQGNLFNTCLYLFAIIIVIYNITGTCLIKSKCYHNSIKICCKIMNQMINGFHAAN